MPSHNKLSLTLYERKHEGDLRLGLNRTQGRVGRTKRIPEVSLSLCWGWRLAREDWKVCTRGWESQTSPDIEEQPRVGAALCVRSGTEGTVSSFV